jgi:hypothetical protein
MLPGFERVSLEAHHRRFRREAARTAPSYGVTFGVGEPEISEGACRTSSFQLDAEGDGWRTTSDIVFYDLACLNGMYERKSMPVRLLRGVGAAFDLMIRGAGLRYLRDGWRFFLFFLFPFLLLLITLGLAALAVLPAFYNGAWNLLWSVPLALAGAAALCLLAKPMHVPLMMDLWALTVDVPRRRHPEVHRMLEALSDDIARRIAATTADEVIVVGHSFGAVPAIMALADPRCTAIANEKPLGLLAAGSYLLAVAHHPSAAKLREAAGIVMQSPIEWLDAQSHTDPINFFRTNPADALGMKDARRPKVVEVRFKQQLEPESYRQIRGDFFRTHRQFVYGVEKRSHYALFAIIGGPEPFSEIVERGGLSADWTRFSPQAKDGDRHAAAS